MFRKKGAFKNITKLSGKFLCQSLFLNIVVAYKETLAQVFSFKYCKIFNIFKFSKFNIFYRTPVMATYGRIRIKSQQNFSSSYFWPHWYDGLPLHCDKIIGKCDIQTITCESVHLYSYHSVICTQSEKFPNIHRMVGALKLFFEWFEC